MVTAASLLVAHDAWQRNALRKAGARLLDDAIAVSKAAQAEGRHRDALILAGAAEALQPTSPRARRAVLEAQVDLLTETPEQASTSLAEEAIVNIRIALKNKTLPEAQLLVGLGNAYLVFKNQSLAAAVFDRAIKVDPKSAEAHLFRGLIANKALPRSAGIDLVHKATTLRKDYHRALLAHGQLTLQGGRFSESMESLQKAVALRPEAASLAALGDVYMGLEQPAEAEIAFANALSHMPTFGEARRKLAEAKLQIGKFREALELLLPLAEATSMRDARVLRLLGIAHSNLKNYAQAMDMFRRQEKIEGPTPEGAWLAAQTAMKMGDRPVLGAALDNFIALAKGRPELASQLADAEKALKVLMGEGPLKWPDKNALGGPPKK